MRRTWMVCLGLAILVAQSFGQSWSDAYEKGLKAVKTGIWLEARKNFKQATAYRPEDVAASTTLPGPISERRTWRDGAPYSPNFLAAYSAYKAAKTASLDSASLMNEAVAEFEALLTKKQYSFETFFFLNDAYSSTSNVQKKDQLAQQYNSLAGKINWKIDKEGLTPEENAAISQSMAGAPTTPNNNGGTTTTQPATGIGIAPIAGRVASIATKYALLIGNSETRLGDGVIGFGSDSAQVLRESLVSNAGYPEENVDLVLNGTSAQILAAAKALSDRIPENATVVIYFAGFGTNSGGKDYLAGVDTQMATDTSTMVAKSDIYKMFMSKGAKMFAFFDANRPVEAGRYFGMEVPMYGSISQMQATTAGQVALSLSTGGKQIGMFTDALCGVIRENRSNRLPIGEFGWQVFYRIRRGNDLGTGSSRQTPTLPVLTNMSDEAKF